MKCNLKNGDMIQIDLKNIFPNSIVCGEYFEDDNGNVEIYIPEGICHTSFYIKIPKNS
jgi:hypothetical protein